MTINKKNLWAGLLFVSLGLFFALKSLLDLRMGTAASMGPGYFPAMLGGILAMLGAAIAFYSVGGPKSCLGAVSWRGLVLVIGSILFFAVTVRGLGFPLALAGTGLFASRSSGRLGWLAPLVVAVAISAFGSLLFVYALKLPYPLIGRWIHGISPWI